MASRDKRRLRRQNKQQQKNKDVKHSRRFARLLTRDLQDTPVLNSSTIRGLHIKWKGNHPGFTEDLFRKTVDQFLADQSSPGPINEPRRAARRHGRLPDVGIGAK